MELIINGMILLGSILMMENIYRYVKFMYRSRDVMSEGKNANNSLEKVSLILLICFLMGYLCVLFFGDPTIVIAGILYGGSIFVSIVLTLMFKLVEMVKTRSMEISELLISVIEARDPNLNGHSLSVRDLTKLFFAYLPRSMKVGINMISLEYAALLHDLGKLGIPEAVLNKPSELSEDEWRLMRMHPKIGADILKSIPSFEYIIDWINFHHERVDGEGYYGISDSNIPLPSKIIAIADTYSAIRMKRSYKSRKSHEEAISIMKEVAGTQLDATLMEYFCAIPKEEIERCIK